VEAKTLASRLEQSAGSIRSSLTCEVVCTYRRATLLVPSGPVHDSERKHLFIVLTDPAQVLDFAVKHSLLVGVTTLHSSIRTTPP